MEPPERLRGMTSDDWKAILREAESTGLATELGNTGAFHLHPLLPWFLRAPLSTAPDLPALEATFRELFAAFAVGGIQGFQQGGLAEGVVNQFHLHQGSCLHALALARQAADLEQVWPLFIFLYKLLEHTGRRTQADQLLDELLHDWQPAEGFDPKSREGQFWLQLQLMRANRLLAQRDLEGAEQVYQQIAKHVGQEGSAQAFHQLGVVAQERRDFDQAEQWYRKSLEIKLRLKNDQGAAGSYHQLGMVAQERRDFDQAEQWYRKSLEIKLRLNDDWLVATSYHQLGVLSLLRGDGQACAGWLVKAFWLFQACNAPHEAQSCIRNLRIAYQRDLITRALLAEAWASETGEALPEEVGAMICVPSDAPEAPLPDLPPEALEQIKPLLAAGLQPEQILTMIEQAHDGPLPPKLRAHLLRQIESL